jgi:uncharacterized protein YuzE
VLEIDARGLVCAITFEHAIHRTNLYELTVERLAA